MPPGMPQAQLVIWSLAFLAAPGLLLPGEVRPAVLGGRRPAGDRSSHALLVFRLFFITLTMTAIGMVALVIWDGMFPDRRDARILTRAAGARPRADWRAAPGARGALRHLSSSASMRCRRSSTRRSIAVVRRRRQSGAWASSRFVVANGARPAPSSSATLVALQGLVLNLGGQARGRPAVARAAGVVRHGRCCR